MKAGVKQIRPLLRKVLSARTKRVIATALRASAVSGIIRRLKSGVIVRRGVRIKIDHPRVSDATFGALFWGFYERAEADQIEKFLPRDADVIELGGSSGVNTMLIARLLDKGRCVTVEADPELCDLLAENCRLNNQAEKVSVVNAAIAYNQDKVMFQRDAGATGGRVVSQTGVADLAVPAVTLSAVVARSGFSQFTLVMDIEGAEWDLIGRPEELKGCQTIIAELHPGGWPEQTVERAAERLYDLGFRTLNRDGCCYVLTRD